jgi:penicillin amidase
MWKFLLCTTLWIALTFALNRPWRLGETTFPPIGKFFSPGSGFWQNAEEKDTTFSNHNISLDGVNGEVQILFDERMVPHIFAQNDLDAYFAQGYVTALHRLWQMDLSSRAAAGELSRILGPRTLEYDKKQRRMGMGFAAENAVKGWEKYPEDMALLFAYADGVNAYIASLDPMDYPIEYKLLNFVPERWTPIRSAYFVKSMATRLCLEEDDLEHTLLLKWLGKERFEALFPERNPNDDPVIPSGTAWNFEPITSPAKNALPDTSIAPNGSKASMRKDYHEGSNNWAVAGARTYSGKPILCNDPHLGLSLPSVWFEIQIVTPMQNVYGVSLPGMPGVIIGFNDHQAWGMTNVGQDVLDWYSIQWTDSTQTEYMLDGEEVTVDYRIENIEVLGGETIIDTVRYTKWGPVQKEGPHEGLAMRWLAHEIPDRREASMFTRLNHTNTYEEFVTVIADFQTPLQNFVFADKQGNIALQVGGKVPLRRDRNGRLVQDGSNSENGWNGSIPSSQNPGVLNPSRGFVSSANQQSTDTTYPYIYHGGFEDFRGRILNRHLAQLEMGNPKDMMSLQNNTVSLKAEELLPLLLGAVSGITEDEKQALNILKEWKYEYVPGSAAPILFELWYDAFYKAVWDDFYVMQDSMYIYAPDAWRTILLAQQDPASAEFDIDSTSVKESFQDVARMSFTTAMEMHKVLDEGIDWGNFRETTIRHLANIPSFNHILRAAPGHGDALNATTRTHGPSWRMIVHLTEPIEAYVVYPGGQSGNPGSPFYDSMISTWEKGEYYSAKYLKTPDELQPMQVLNLKPSAK